jgi:hypothetical protein
MPRGTVGLWEPIVRREFVVVGVVLAIAGGVLWVVPVPGSFPSRTFDSSARSWYALNVSVQPTVGSLNSQIQFAASWASTGGTAAAQNSVWVYSCGYNANCSKFDPSSAPVAQGSGASGTLHWTGGTGELFMVTPRSLGPGSNVSVTVTYGETLLGGVASLVFVVAGVGLAAVGMISRPPLTTASAKP